MECGAIRESLSGRLDGEPPRIGSEELDRHVTAWSVRAEGLHRIVRVRAAELVPDLTATIVERGPARRHQRRCRRRPLEAD
jgi:predicted anti-sigma-YlaC factor YlaD